MVLGITANFWTSNEMLESKNKCAQIDQLIEKEVANTWCLIISFIFYEYKFR